MKIAFAKKDARVSKLLDGLVKKGLIKDWQWEYDLDGNPHSKQYYDLILEGTDLMIIMNMPQDGFSAVLWPTDDGGYVPSNLDNGGLNAVYCSLDSLETAVKNLRKIMKIS